MLSGGRGQPPPAAEVNRSTAQPGHLYDAPMTVRQLMPTNFESGPCPTLEQTCPQDSQLPSTRDREKLQDSRFPAESAAFQL